MVSVPLGQMKKEEPKRVHILKEQREEKGFPEQLENMLYTHWLKIY